METHRYGATEQEHALIYARELRERFKGGLLKELLPYPNFVTWKYTKDNKKLPINPKTGRAASPTDPDTWTSAGVALKRLAEGRENGIGFNLSHTPFVAIDLDDRVHTNRRLDYQA